MRVAILGIGEAGSLFGRDIASVGIEVVGFDIREVEYPPGVVAAASIDEAVGNADLVLSLVTAASATTVAMAARPSLSPTTVYADLNTGSPQLKLELAHILGPERLADVALLAPVPRQGVRTPAMVSGGGADAYANMMAAFGREIEVVPGPVGSASSRKLIRSVFMKSLSTIILEALAAGRAAGCEDWVKDQIIGELNQGGEATVDRVTTGTYMHAARRLKEMQDTRRYLLELGAPMEMTESTIAWLSAIVLEGRR